MSKIRGSEERFMTGGWGGILLCSGQGVVAAKSGLDSEAKLHEVWVLLVRKSVVRII